MQKIEIIENISVTSGVNKFDVRTVLEHFFTQVKTAVILGESVYIRGFGTFMPKKRAAKIGRNIKTNESVVIPEHCIPAFKPSKEFKSDVKARIKKENVTPTF